MQKQLKLKLRADQAPSWDEVAREEWLARFVRTLEAGKRRARNWHLRPLDLTGRIGWEARVDRPDRTQRLTLSADNEVAPTAAEWTLIVESGPPESGPASLRGGEWLVGAALAVAAWLVATPRFGWVAGALAAVTLLLVCGLVLPHLAWRKDSPTPGDEPDPVDEELLDRVRRGAEAFAGFQLITPEWHEPDLP
jgi:4-amino-4-deoxy-L-arabinose transferase-like glycosyltransferase